MAMYPIYLATYIIVAPAYWLTENCSRKSGFQNVVRNSEGLGNLIYSLSLTENPEYYQYIFLSITVGLLGIFAMMLWSAFETNNYCNRQNMPYVGGEFELEMQNTKRATTILFLVTSIVLLLLIHAAMTFEFD